MNLLPQFDYEIFLSYGWADNGDSKVGDRAWVGEFKRALEREVSDNLPHGIRVYLDIEHSQNGTVPENLEAALRSSALFLLVLTENSCRPDSWCQKLELPCFLEHSLDPVARDRSQIFSVRIRDVDRALWPEGMNPYVFGAMENGRFRQFDVRDLTDRDRPCGQKFSDLAADIANQLKKIQEVIQKADYLAETSEKAAGKLEKRESQTRFQGRIPLRCKGSEPGSEEDFRSRVLHLLRWSSRSIHMVDDSFDLKPEQWSSSTQQLQLILARQRFTPSEGKPITIWKDPSSQSPSYELLAQSFEHANIICNQPFEEMQTFVDQDGKNRSMVADTRVNGGRFVYLQCVKGDQKVIELLAPYFKRNEIHLRPPVFGGPALQRQEFNEEFAQRCHGVAVYFGNRNELNTLKSCNETRAALGQRAAQVPKVVLLHPPTDGRQHFFHPDFHSHAWDDQAHPPANLQQFIEQVLEAPL